MTEKGEVKPTRMINPDSEQRTTTSADIFETKTSNVPMPISWAEAGLEYGMLVTRRDKGDDWAYLRKLWREMLMVVWQRGLDAKVFLFCVSASDWWIDFRIELSRKELEMGNRIMLVQSSARAFFFGNRKN